MVRVLAGGPEREGRKVGGEKTPPAAASFFSSSLSPLYHHHPFCQEK